MRGPACATLSTLRPGASLACGALSLLLITGDGVVVTSPPVRPATGGILVEARVAVAPLAEGVRVGGTMEIGGINRRIDAAIGATGHAMLGLSLAPATGRILADLLSGAILPCPIEALAPERFG